MIVFIITLCVLLLVVVGMSVGVLMGRGPIKGSCGGMGAVGIDSNCEICGGNAKKCEDSRKTKDTKETSADLAYDATKKE